MTTFDANYLGQFIDNLQLCEKAADNLEFTLQGVHDWFPLQGDQLAKLSRDQVEKLDAMTARFSRLQDLLGERLFKSLTILESEPWVRFLDVLNAMEKRGIIPSTQQWIELRNMRNEAAHGYINEEDRLATVLTDMFVQSPRLIESVKEVKRYAREVLQMTL